VGLTQDAGSNLTGLSLSGGGLRSSCFGLGFVQALHRCGLWRYLDYLSTVSGGGYIGAYLSSKVVREERPFDKDYFPLAVDKSGRQSPDTQKFIYGGDLFYRPFALLNKYLIGLFLINLTFFAAIVAIGALIAFLWRCFDYPAFRDRAGLVGLNSDFLAPFWPFWACLLFWLSAWVVSYWRRGSEAPGRLARYALFGTLASLLVGWALLAGNGDIPMGGAPQSWFSGESPINSTVWGPIVAIVLGGLLPFIKPSRLIQSGLNPKAPWERYVFRFATTCMFVGVPLILVGILAKENISGWNDHAYRPLIKEDIDSWPELCELLPKPKEDRKEEPSTPKKKPSTSKKNPPPKKKPQPQSSPQYQIGSKFCTNCKNRTRRYRVRKRYRVIFRRTMSYRVRRSFRKTSGHWSHCW
jgi:hypothetical protein